MKFSLWNLMVLVALLGIVLPWTVVLAWRLLHEVQAWLDTSFSWK